MRVAIIITRNTPLPERAGLRMALLHIRRGYERRQDVIVAEQKIRAAVPSVTTYVVPEYLIRDWLRANGLAAPAR